VPFLAFKTDIFSNFAAKRLQKAQMPNEYTTNRKKI